MGFFGLRMPYLHDAGPIGIGISVFNVLNKIGSFDLVVAIAYVILLGMVGGLMLKESITHLRATESNKHRRSHQRPHALATAGHERRQCQRAVPV